ncbi:MAG: 4Fe-4S binding protein [Thermodesulfobacteriota bacterium]
MATGTYMGDKGRELARKSTDVLILDRQARRARVAQAQKTRRVKQIILGTAFLLLLGAGWVYPLVGYFIPVCMLLGIGLAAFKGRSWCDWLCPRGSFADALLGRISPKRRIPQVFPSTFMRVGVMALLMGMLTFQIIRLWPDPYAIGGFFVLLLSVTTGVGVALGVTLHPRTWCYICPIGTMSSWVGKNRRPLYLAPEKCTQCNLCARQCPMQLAPAALKEEAAMAHRGDCLKCSLCVASCPTAALSFQESRTGDAAA